MTEDCGAGVRCLGLALLLMIDGLIWVSIGIGIGYWIWA